MLTPGVPATMFDSLVSCACSRLLMLAFLFHFLVVFACARAFGRPLLSWHSNCQLCFCFVTVKVDELRLVMFPGLEGRLTRP